MEIEFKYCSYALTLQCQNGIYRMYKELQWHFSKDESCSGVSQIARNCSGVYLHIKDKLHSFIHVYLHNFICTIFMDFCFLNLASGDASSTPHQMFTTLHFPLRHFQFWKWYITFNWNNGNRKSKTSYLNITDWL